MSRYPERLLNEVAQNAGKLQIKDIIKDPYIFEFLGLPAKDVFRESDLEEALMQKLQEFLLELGRVFCFEARQKRLLIGADYFFVDLVFYHRVLKCHVLIDLKTEAFNHAHAGQMNMYLNYFSKNESAQGDNPPVDIVLCTSAEREHVEYATGGMDRNLFVSQYIIALPTQNELEAFLTEQRRELVGA